VPDYSKSMKLYLRRTLLRSERYGAVPMQLHSPFCRHFKKISWQLTQGCCFGFVSALTALLKNGQYFALA